VAESMLTKVRRLEALRAQRAALKVKIAQAWAAYYRACDAAEMGEIDPDTKGIPAPVQANIERLWQAAQAVEAEYRKVYRAEQALAGEILGIADGELGIADEGEAFGEVREVRALGVVAPMVAQMEAV